ncbi:Uncharacterised protein at_DN0930 [Pycnogonum litorale]
MTRLLLLVFASLILTVNVLGLPAQPDNSTATDNSTESWSSSVARINGYHGNDRYRNDYQDGYDDDKEGKSILDGILGGLGILGLIGLLLLAAVTLGPLFGLVALVIIVIIQFFVVIGIGRRRRKKRDLSDFGIPDFYLHSLERKIIYIEEFWKRFIKEG